MVESNASAGLAWLPKDGSLSSLFNSRDSIVPQLGGGRVVLACLSPQTTLGGPDQIPSSTCTCAGQGFLGRRRITSWDGLRPFGRDGDEKQP